MRAILLIGHGSLLAGSGAAMIRLAARLREQQVAPLAAAGFLNYSRPDLGSALERLHRQGATEIVIQPYFLVAGWFVERQLPKKLAPLIAIYPHIVFRFASAFLDHPVLAEILLARAAAIKSTAEPTAIVVVAHGSPDAGANQPVESLVEIMRQQTNLQIELAYLGLNQPLLSDILTWLITNGWQQIIVVPHFLQFGGHVAEDLPVIIEVTRQKHPGVNLHLAAYIGYDPALTEVIADRVAAARLVEGRV